MNFMKLFEKMINQYAKIFTLGTESFVFSHTQCIQKIFGQGNPRIEENIVCGNQYRGIIRRERSRTRILTLLSMCSKD